MKKLLILVAMLATPAQALTQEECNSLLIEFNRDFQIVKLSLQEVVRLFELGELPEDKLQALEYFTDRTVDKRATYDRLCN